MSWLSEFVFDPIKALIAKSATSVEADLAALAAKAAAVYLPTPTPPAATQAVAVTDLENLLQSAVDGFVTTSLGSAGPVGVALTPEAVTAANDLLAYGEAHAVAFVSALFAHVKGAVATAA